MSIVVYALGSGRYPALFDSSGADVTNNKKFWPAAHFGIVETMAIRPVKDDFKPYTKAELDEFVSFDFGMDVDYDTTTTPPIRTTTGFTIEEFTEIIVEADPDAGIEQESITWAQIVFTVDYGTDEAKAKLGSKDSFEFKSALNGYKAGQSRPGLIMHFPHILLGRILEGGTGTPNPVEDGNYNSAQIDALIRAGYELQFSIDGETSWHDTQAKDVDWYWRYRYPGGEWSPAVYMSRGIDAYVYVAYASDDAGADFSLTPSDSLKYRAEIHVAEPITTPVIADFSAAAWIKYLGDTGATGATGADGQDAFVYVAYASDNAGTGWSMTPSDSLKYRAEIHTIVEISTPSASDFSGATWVKYIGDNPDGTTPQGDYDSGTTYVLNNGVTYNGSYYRSLANDNTGNQPDTSPTYWELMVAKGNTGDTGATGATNISITTPVIWDENFEAFAYQLSDVDSYVRFSIVKTMSALKLGVVSANPTYTGNAVVFPTTGRTALTQAGWTASTGVSGAYYRDADISGITFVTEDDKLIENVASVAALTAGQWAVGDEDSIGSNRLYVYPTAGNDPTADGDGFYQYDTVSSQTVAVGATPAEITITASFTGYKCLELWRDTFDANDTLDNGGVVVGMNILDGAEYSK